MATNKTFVAKTDSGPLVVALGGNALESIDSNEDTGQLGRLCRTLAPYRHGGLLVTHGNGPQVGYLDELQNHRQNSGAKRQPLDVLGAETEGWLGYEIQRGMSNALDGRAEAVSVLSCMEVGADDPAMLAPGKPIGGWYAADQARKLTDRYGWRFQRRGEQYRRVVPSPRPLACPQLQSIVCLLDNGHVVICAGGGGIPVARDASGNLQGVEAVIDKDMASALLARELGASLLVLATNVDAVYRQWSADSNTGEDPVRQADPGDLASLALEAGSMAPKVQAACQFVQLSGGRAVIGHLAELERLLVCEAGTIISSADEGFVTARTEEELAHE